MSKTFGTVLKVVLSVGLAGLLLYFVFRRIDFNDFVSRLDNVEYSWVYFTMALSLIGYLLRAYRWKLQLVPLGYQVSTFRMFVALMTGYLTNLVIPRLGEVTRCGVLFKSDKVPVSTGLGTVITERIVDLIALVLILLATFILQSEQLILFFTETVDFPINWKWILLILVAGFTSGVWIFVRFIYHSKSKIGEFSRQMVTGLLSLKDVHLGKFLASTIGIWVIYFLMSYLVVFALKETAHLPWLVGFSILSAGVIAFTLPVQSGFGTFHALVAVMLTLYGIEHETGVFFATLLHASQLIAALFYGLVAIVFAVFMKRNENKK
jgi:uncharacterized protein (TIRG00374 family)